MQQSSQAFQIPDNGTLDRLYEPAVRDLLIEIRKVVAGVRDPLRRLEVGRRMIRNLWPDPQELIANTHWIRTKRPGETILFQPNHAQQRLYKLVQQMQEENRPVRIIILKARQLGFSTWIQSFFYELFDRNQYHSSLVISFDEMSTNELFQKTVFIHKNLWFPRPLERDSKGVVEATLPHGSNMFVRTAGNIRAGRSQTFHALHCSEIPMWDDSGETLLSAMQAVPVQAGSYVFFESTAMGAVGDFYDYWKGAERGENSFEPFFAPWFWDPEYAIDFADADSRRRFGKSLNNRDQEYRKRYNLSLEQMNWRQWCVRDRCQGSLRRFRQEYPACAEEAFLTTGSPVFNPEKVAELTENATNPRWQGDLLLLKR